MPDITLNEAKKYYKETTDKDPRTLEEVDAILKEARAFVALDWDETQLATKSKYVDTVNFFEITRKLIIKYGGK